MLSVILVEDSQDVQALLRSLLESIPGVVVAGVAEGTEDAKRLVDECHPDVVLLDVALRGGDRGYDVLRYVTREHPQAQVLALSNMSWQALRDGFLQAGAAAYFDKTFQFGQALGWISRRAAGLGAKPAQLPWVAGAWRAEGESPARPCSMP